jgi:type I restriction enzyme M protein
MKEIIDKKRKQDLGSFYTDRKIVEFIFDILSLWKTDEDKKKKRWQSHDGASHFPSVIDPAVGEGAFLKVALEKNFSDSDHIFGLDIDENAVNKWPETHLLKSFGNRISTMRAHFFHQNGLDKIHWEQHKKYYGNKLKKSDIENQRFDVVVGNPPYGGTGLGFNQINNTVIENIKDFELLPHEVRNNLTHSNNQASLGFYKDEKKDKLSQDARKRMQSFPIEVLFIERFIQLAKPGGWIAIVIPDGILANSNMHNVREFIARKTKVSAIISLPRDAFKNVGTNAKTSILFLQKLKKEADLNKDLDYSVFLVSIAGMEQNNFDTLFKSYKNFFEKGVLND